MSCFRILGLMSGTSLDGLDIVDVVLKKVDSMKWTAEILHAETVLYTPEILKRLNHAVNESALGITRLSHDLGMFFGYSVNNFLIENGIDRGEIDAISSHGHTIFHQPDQGITLQIGNGPELSVFTGLKSVCDFRVMDVLLGGNGAPLVPVGDQLLFSSEAESFLNLGGFSNISFFKNGRVNAFDICPVNVVLNKLSEQVGKKYDEFGLLGRKGTVCPSLLNSLNNLPFYEKSFPKSLGIEWVHEFIDPIVKNDAGVITTYYEHIAIQIADVLKANRLNSVFVTGGGAKNTFLIERIKQHYSGKIIIPNELMVDFKEAVIFALLGALRLSNEINVWSSVTGAQKDSISGIIHNSSW